MGCWITRNPSLPICSSDGQYPVHAGTPRTAPGKSMEILPLPMATLLSAAEIQKMGNHVCQANKWLGSQSEGQWLLS